MATLVLDSYVEDQILEQRRASGGDRFDEVWDGVYVMSPLANNEHQLIATRLSTILQVILNFGERGLVFAGVNVSDRDDGWKQNYRCPDVAVFLNGTSAINRESHWLGGPDFAVEVASQGDRSREKLGFYATVNTREVLIVDRDPWALELYRLVEGTLTRVGTSRPGDAEALPSEVVPLAFRLIAAEPRPMIEVARRDERGESWRI
ncbi:Uma2 family endonuclease [Tautonia marina]|uniref:Uma2 family endonuclease n=1 Tax=Tautonia marina TaxID=2653855 RepID=UPI0013762CDC|nr:Uma2 family endonuclease [Tautonia marina]